MAEPTPQPASKPLLQVLASAGAAGPEDTGTGEIELFRVQISGSPFAIESGLIHEVIRIPPITPLPMAPPFLAGVATHRGDVVAVVDLARLLGRGETQVGGRSRLAIARCEGMVVGLLAEEVIGLARYPAAAMQAAPLGTESSEFISGLVLGGEPLDVLDLRRALASARERASAKR